MTLNLRWTIPFLAVLAAGVLLACGAASPPSSEGSAKTTGEQASAAEDVTHPEGTSCPQAVTVGCLGDAFGDEGTSDTSAVASENPPAPAEATAAGTQPEAPVAVMADKPVVEVKPDPDYEEKLKSAGINVRGWETDFSLHTVPYDSIMSGGPPRDGIPPIDAPTFVTFAEADEWLDPLEPVVSFVHGGDARAYPLQVMTWHEIVNDEVGGIPVSVTFCPLCNSAIVFHRELDGNVYTFGTTGKLRNSDLIMWDRQTETWWQQLTGEGIVGELAGRTLTFLPAAIISWSDFKSIYPDGKVLSKATGYLRSYGSNPYVGYDRVDKPPFLYDGELDDRLQPKERVLTVEIGETYAAFPFSVLETELVVNHNVGGVDLVALFKPGARSALDKGIISSSRQIGATGLFLAELDGEKLTFKSDGGRFVDNETGSVWNIRGKAVEGPLQGKTLTPVPHTNSFWFAVAAFRPDTEIYRGMK